MKKRKYTLSVPPDDDDHGISSIVPPEYIIYFSGFLDLFGVSMILPLILPQARDLGASSTLAGILGSVYGSMQLFSGPIIGNWSDSIDRRMSLTLVLFLSAVGYGLLGIATSIAMMFLARLPLGIFKHSQGISKSYLADFIPAHDRNTVLGHFNAASSIGFILGPMVGGHIAELPGGFNMVGLLSAFIFILNSGLIWLTLPSVKPSHHLNLAREDSVTSLKKLNSDEINFSPRLFLDSLKQIDWKDLWDWFLIKFLMGFSVILFRSNFSLMTREKYGVGAMMNGYLMSFSGATASLAGFFVGRISNRYRNDYKLIKHMSLLLTFTLLGLITSPNMWILVMFLPILSLATSVLRVATTSLTIERGKNQGIGATIGLHQSIMSIARMLSSVIAGVSLEFSNSGPGILALFSSCVALILLILRPQDAASKRKKNN
ncbi:major facilitator superfamily domain-containing protein 9 [Patella vulgata]|uniref:major facilitator superfamily domain-containing protein 9 n=1 Tax=Patella vulgata TaxID=6465 RepID=UPI0021808C91|nr:major facilitator superfamily domain-containing protein 9 [Patella vulgata]